MTAREALDVARRDAGLDLHPPAQRVEAADALQPFQREHQPTADRDGPARETRPAPTRNDGHPMPEAGRDDVRDLLRTAGADDRVGQRLQPTTLRRVAIVRSAGLRQMLRAHDRRELGP